MSNVVAQGPVNLEDGSDCAFEQNTGPVSGRERPNNVQMSVPNPKRTVPVNFLSLPDEDSYSPFLDEPHEPVPNSSLQSNSTLLKPCTTATPEIFDFSSEVQQHESILSVRTSGSAASNADQSGFSRGIIGSARKCKSSNSLGPSGEGDGAPGSTWSGGLSDVILGRTTSPLGPVGGAIRPASTSPAPSASSSRLHLLNSTDRQLQIGPETSSADSGSLTSPWDSVQYHQRQQMQHMPICRPSSTPAYPTSITSLFKTDHFDLGFGDNNVLRDSSSNNHINDVRSSREGHLNDLLRSGDAASTSSVGASSHSGGVAHQATQAPVRGRDRDYSFGSLLGLSDLSSKLTLRGHHSNATADNDSMKGVHLQDNNSGRRVAFGAVTSSSVGDNDGGVASFALGDDLLKDGGGSSAGRYNSSSMGVFDFHSGGNGGLTQRESLRAGLSLGGTVSAPPQFLTGLYATEGFGSSPIGTHSGSSAPSATTGLARPLAASTTTYASVIGGLHHQSSGRSSSPHPIAAVGTSSLHGSRTHSPLPQAGFGAISQLQPQEKQMRQSPVPMQSIPSNIAAASGGGGGAGPNDSSVEGAVLRSCREILAGAADRSLKAVELANTLRARVGTESLARVREQWGGLLSLLEKHSAHFRVDRIPKNDKVTLVSGDSSDDDDAGVFGEASSAGGGGRSGALRGGSKSQHGSSAHSGETGGWSAASGASAAGATRCLHVGNVPANMSEVQLMREFEKFGQLDGLKLVSQRNGTRRFAFITFHSIEQAITARHCLSKVHPWKSAISFAHKEFTQHGGSNGGGISSGGPSVGGHLPLHHQQHHHHQQQQLQHQIMMMSQAQMGLTGASPYGVMPDYQQQQQLGGNLLYQMQNNHQMMMAQQQANMSMMSPYSYMSAPYGGVLGGPQQQQQQQAAPYWMQQVHPPSPQQHHHLPPQPFANPGDSFLPLGSGSSGAPPLQSFTAPAAQSQQQHSQSQHAAQSFPQPGADMDCPVLRRLCDDTYVPTQPWPVDLTRDQPYCLAVIAQLQHFDGYTTISKLRGFLRNRVAAVDNIKSVPLKAMLVAYPQYFTLVSNYVHLVNNNQPIPAV